MSDEPKKPARKSRLNGHSPHGVGVDETVADAGVHASAHASSAPTDPESLVLEALNPTMNAAAIIKQFSAIAAGLELPTIAAELDRQTLRAFRGDMQRATTMLVAQAHVLDSLFTGLAVKASEQRQPELHLQTALQAQSQCRATLETLVALKSWETLREAFAAAGMIEHAPSASSVTKAADAHGFGW